MSRGFWGIYCFDKEQFISSSELEDMVQKRVSSFSWQTSISTTVLGNVGIAIWEKTGVRRSQLSLGLKNNVLLSFYGELYNYEQIKNKVGSEYDCEATDISGLIAKLYLKYGSKFIEQLEGLYALSLFKRDSGKLILYRDFCGATPAIYWNNSNGRMVFSTDLMILVWGLNRTVKLSWDALTEFFKYSYISAPNTAIQGIKKLSPGEMLICKKGRVQSEIKTKFSISSTITGDVVEIADQYQSLLLKALTKRIHPNDRNGYFLSGGLDTGANIALSSRISSKRIKTFTVGFINKDIDERPQAKKVAERYGTEHHEYVINGREIAEIPRLIAHFGDPFFDNGTLLTYSGYNLAKDYVDVVIGGEGVDQMFGCGGGAGAMPVGWRFLMERLQLQGIIKYLNNITNSSLFQKNSTLNMIKVFLARTAELDNWYAQGFTKYDIQNLYKGNLQIKNKKTFENGLLDYEKTLENIFNYGLLIVDFQNVANECILFKSGRMSDLFSLNFQNPFLDRDVLEFVFSVDFNLKRKGTVWDFLRGKTVAKYIHRSMAEHLLPSESFKSKQGGFAPSQLFLKPKQEVLFSYLMKSEIIAEFFNREYVIQIFKNYLSLERKGNYFSSFIETKANQIIYLLVFDIWHRIYIQNDITVQNLSLSEYLLTPT